MDEVYRIGNNGKKKIENTGGPKMKRITSKIKRMGKNILKKKIS